MTRRLILLRNGAFALAIAATLGFGATQALAGTAPAQAARSCDDTLCNWECEQLGAGGGYCNSYGQCECLL